MTTQANIPAKWYVPFAQGDASRVEIPVTTADPTRASQTLGFPPLTMQPPESGGVPPQGEDFNGGMNQIARVAWWVLNGGGWPYDASFATNVNINGYPNGAKLQSADFRGDWISTVDGNQNNPDTTGTGWVPGFQYGVTALAGLTGGTVTPTPAQAAKGSITLAGTLTSALTVILPAWIKNWSITNNTTGAFVTIVKTAAGSGVTIPQNGAPTRVSGDGTNIVQSPENVATATSLTQPAQLGQVQTLITNMQVFTAGGSFVVPANVTKIKYRAQGAGAGGGGSIGSNTAAGGGGSGSYSEGTLSVTPGASLTIAIGAGGTQGTSGAGGSGGSTTITGTGIAVTAFGGAGSSGATSGTPLTAQGSGGAVATATGASVLASINAVGAPGHAPLSSGPGGYFGGNGASSNFGGGVQGNGAYPGATPGAYGAAGAGGANNNYGGNGAGGLVVLEW